jgi:uncharacterized protein YbaP (TraB family)
MSVFWEIRPRGGGPTSYVLGTMHVRDARVFRYRPLYAEHLERCTVFMPEYDLFDPSAHVFHDALILPPGETVRDLLPRAVADRLARLLREEAGMALGDVQHLTPFALLQMLAEFCLGREYHLPLDAVLYEDARRLGLSCAGLETPEEHFSTLSKMPENDFLRSLIDALRDFGRFRRRSRRMLDSYVRGDLNGLLRLGRRQLGGLREVMLFERNRAMSVHLVNKAREEAVFAAVGAAHLPGGKGMLRLIKHSGFAVRPVPTEPFSETL